MLVKWRRWTRRLESRRVRCWRGRCKEGRRRGTGTELLGFLQVCVFLCMCSCVSVSIRAPLCLHLCVLVCVRLSQLLGVCQRISTWTCILVLCSSLVSAGKHLCACMHFGLLGFCQVDVTVCVCVHSVCDCVHENILCLYKCAPAQYEAIEHTCVSSSDLHLCVYQRPLMSSSSLTGDCYWSQTLGKGSLGLLRLALM